MAILPNLPPMKVYWHAPAPLFAARVNMPGSITYPIQDITFDYVTVGAYTDLAADMFVTFGSAEGLDDLGRTRLRAAPTSTVLKIGRSSQGYEDGQVDIVDDAWVHVYADFRVHAKIPTIVNYVEYKDADLAVGDLTQAPPPVATMGPDRARRIDASTEVARFYFDSAGSYAVADGATIVSVAWDSAGGTFVLGTSATDAAVYIDFPAGARYVSLTVTDSNGKTHTTRRLVLADDPVNSLCVSGMQVTSMARTIEGMTVRLRVLQDLPRSDYPDGAHILIWEDRDPAIYGSPDPTDWSDVLFTGWHQTDEASATDTDTHLHRDTALTCVDIAGRLDSLPGFNQRIEKPDDDGVWTWGEMDAPNMDKFLVYLLHWHSTALAVADFYPSGTWDDYPFVLFDAVGDTLYNQLSRQANRIVRDHQFTCDRYGRLKVVVDPQLQDPDDRTATVHNNVTEQSWQAIDFGYQRPPRVHTLRGSAVLTGTDYELDGEGAPIIETAFCIAPGTAPGQGGRESTLGERLAQSQDALNSCIGHHYARLNARYGDITVTLNSNADPWLFDPAALTWVVLHTPAGTAPQRGLDFVTTRCLCKEVNIDYSYAEEGTTYRARVVLEPETVGLPALTEVQEAALPVGEQPLPTVPPDFGLLPDAEVLAAIAEDGYLYRTSDFQTLSSSGGPTWTQHDLGIADDKVYSFVVDPFSPGYINGSGAVNGWVVTESDIYRVTDFFGTPAATSVHTFDVATDPTDIRQTRTIQASFGAYFSEGVNPWLLVISHYADETGHTGTWALRSLNGGVTWQEEVIVTEFYQENVTSNTVPVDVGVYTSPKTPGYAITTAYVNTAESASVREFYSLDWGATWTQREVIENPDEPLAMFGVLMGGVGMITSEIGDEFVWQVIASSDGDGFSGLVRILVAMPNEVERIEITGDTDNFILSNDASTYASDNSTNVPGTRFQMLANDKSFSTGGSQYGWQQEVRFHASLQTYWNKGREDLIAEYGSITSEGAYFSYDFAVSAGGFLGHETINVLTMRLRITEIELVDSTIYVPEALGLLLKPGFMLAAAIHVPWATNDDELVVYSSGWDSFGGHNYQTIRAPGDNTKPEDITPSNFGPVRSGFGLRAYDNDRSFLVMGAAENDGSLVPSEAQHGVFVSDDEGDTWTQVLGPTAETAFTGKRGYSAAFSGTDPDVIYIWGAPDGEDGCISYTDDFGDNVDDRTGNLTSFTITSFLGIAGGPSGS